MNSKITHLLAGLAITTAASAKTIPNNAAADLVLGQVNFTTGALSATTASSCNQATAVTMDPISGKLFVAQRDSNRILRFANAAALQNGAPAEAVFGQPNFTTTLSNPVANLRVGPSALFFDRFKRLWVADASNHRVLMFSAADVRDSEAHPDKVFGQPDFTTTSPGLSATKMSSPTGLWVDKDDRLWVTEQTNQRILRFDSVSNNPAVNSAADGVIGQPDFTTNSHGSSKNELSTPSSVTVSASGQLYVADFSNNRVLRFDNAASSSGLVNASAVLGQANFTANSSGTSATQMDNPAGVFITPDDSLWVTDYGNNRLLRFNNASPKPSGAAADGLLGQPDFTTKTPGTTSQKLNTPLYAAFVDAKGSLWTADYVNNRVLRFSPDATPPLLAVTPPAKVSKKPLVTIKGTASDTYGISKVEYRIGTGPLKLANGTTAWSFKVKLKKGRNVITIIATDVDGISSVSQTLKITRK